jgi:hypothetical protein
MTVIRKKTKQNSLDDLRRHIETFLKLLKLEGEDESVSFLEGVSAKLQSLNELENDTELQDLLCKLQEGFDGDLELIAFTFHKPKDDNNWGIADELYLASMAVLNLVNRLKKE